MSRKCKLSTMTKQMQFVIRKDKYIDKQKLIDFGKEYCEEYSFILHENDIEPKTGLVETKHYHYVCKLRERTRCSTLLNRIVSYFGFNNENGIEIEKWISYEGALQYLIHKNQPEKTPHNIDEITTNIPKSDFNLFMTVDLDSSFSYDLVFSTCLSHNNISEVYRELWPFVIKSSNYRCLIREIFNELKGITH